MLANSSRYLSAWVRARVLESPGKGCPDDHVEVEGAVYFTSKTFKFHMKNIKRYSRNQCLLRLFLDSSVDKNTEPPKGFPGGSGGKEPTCQCRRLESCRLDPWVGKTPGGGHGNPLQYSCLENPTDRGAWGLQFLGSSDTTEATLHTRTIPKFNRRVLKRAEQVVS